MSHMHNGQHNGRGVDAKARNHRAVEKLFAAHRARTQESASGKSFASIMNTTITNGSAAPTPVVTRAALDVPSHMARQLRVAAGMQTHLTPAEHRELLNKATALSSKALVSDLTQATGHGDDSSSNTNNKSCFVLQLRVAQHAVDMGRPMPLCDSLLDPTPEGSTVLYDAQGGRVAKGGARGRSSKLRQRQEAIWRYEQSIPRRRAMDPYVSLTGAQLDAAPMRPNTFTADKLAERYDGRWPLDNRHHQLLLRGKPVMSRIMQGEFYTGEAATSATGATRKSRPPSTNFIAANKRLVRCASRHNAQWRKEHCHTQATQA